MTTERELPQHIDEIVHSIGKFRKDHYENAAPIQRSVNRLTAWISRPSFVGILLIAIASWIAFNVLTVVSGHTPIDPPPFYWLEDFGTLAALCIAALILTTQRHADELAEHREQLTLQLALLADKKSTKIIQLLEELRRDSPQVQNRVDPEAAAMAEPADANAMLKAIKSADETSDG
jgi:uncharacterized membrane protein